MIALVTDSASMLPPPWQTRDDVEIVPVVVTLDGAPRREGVDLDAETFYRRLAEGAAVTTAAPSPGEVLAAYRAAAAAGADEIVSIHTGTDYSAVVDAARLAARETEIPVEVVDSGTASFPVALCVAAAADARRAGGDRTAVVEAAHRTAAVVDSIFVVGAPDLARQGGRLPAGLAVAAMTLLTLGPAGLGEHDTVGDLDQALEAMAGHVVARAATGPLRVGVGDADRPGLGDDLAARIGAVDGIVELTRYQIGPSVGAHGGAGTVGAVWAPLPER